METLQAATQLGDRAQYRAPTAPPLACPACAEPMLRTRVARAEVELDTCARHGTWYDRDEMGRVAAAIRSSTWRAPIELAAVGAAAGALALGTAAPAQPQPSVTMDQVNAGLADAAGVTAEVALEVGAEGALDVVFGLLGALLE
jgi:hypothetical protein